MSFKKKFQTQIFHGECLVMGLQMSVKNVRCATTGHMNTHMCAIGGFSILLYNEYEQNIIAYQPKNTIKGY
jgi:hypothetical protein